MKGQKLVALRSTAARKVAKKLGVPVVDLKSSKAKQEDLLGMPCVQEELARCPSYLAGAFIRVIQRGRK